MSSTPKQDISTFTVNYWDELGQIKGTDTVRALPLRPLNGDPGLKDLLILQEQLLRCFVFNTPAIGEILCSPDLFSIIEKMSKILWVVGKKERGIDLNNLLESGDYVQIGQIFVSESYNPQEIIPSQSFKPSLIAKIHKLDFGGKIAKYTEELAKQREQKAQAEMEEALREIEGTVLPVAEIPKSI